MKIYKILFCGVLLMSLLNSCRQEDDFVVSYAGSDALVSGMAERSYSAQFDALWKAVNSNYVAWEIETVDWNAVYRENYPKFVELDTLSAHGIAVTNEKLEEMYHAVLDTLHDGHAKYSIKNFATDEYITIKPSGVRNAKRFGAGYQTKLAPFDFDYRYYASSLVPEAERIVDYDEVNTSSTIIIKEYLNQGKETLLKAAEKAQTEEDKQYLLEQYNAIDNVVRKHLNAILSSGEDAIIQVYNLYAAEMHDAHMPQYNTEMTLFDRLIIKNMVTNDGIAYLKFSLFGLSNSLELTEDDLKKLEEEGYELDAAQRRSIKRVWKKWFDSIQTLRKAGKLKGVIIDMRCNGGGMTNDQQYVLGALLPSGGHKLGTFKTKNGTGRLDYSIDYDFTIETMSGEHAVIDDVPIVAMCDHNTVSNAEITTIGIKQLPNGYVVGSQSHGGMCILYQDWSLYSITYCGEFGSVADNTPIYGYQPVSLVNYTGYGVLEGKGVTPTEGYNMEYAPVTVTDPDDPSITYVVDNQLEAAFKLVRSK